MPLNGYQRESQQRGNSASQEHGCIVLRQRRVIAGRSGEAVCSGAANVLNKPKTGQKIAITATAAKPCVSKS
ncbi:MAG: hypothetical protein QOF63_3942 [Thermoanaerobaculia bacterium]|nr:hypothetical protein [Thermoanaerobaculia bacterium]